MRTMKGVVVAVEDEDEEDGGRGKTSSATIIKTFY